MDNLVVSFEVLCKYRRVDLLQDEVVEHFAILVTFSILFGFVFDLLLGDDYTIVKIVVMIILILLKQFLDTNIVFTLYRIIFSFEKADQLEMFFV